MAQQILSLQNEDGTWGYEFYSLAVPNNKKPRTTEQALRRLKMRISIMLIPHLHFCGDCEKENEGGAYARENAE